MELNSSIPSLVDDKFTRYSANLNTSMVEMMHMLLSTKDFQENVVYNLSSLEKDQSSIKRLLSGIFYFLNFLNKNERYYLDSSLSLYLK